MDWLPYLEFAAPLLPWKAAAKSVLTHTASLSLGLAAFITAKTMNLSRRKAEGDTTMTPSASKTPSWFDYLVAHPLTLPFWVWAVIYLCMTFTPLGWTGIAFPVLYFFLWLRLYQQSLTMILEHHSAAEEKEVLSCTVLAKT